MRVPALRPDDDHGPRGQRANGVNFDYRDTGESEIPLVLLQRFRGNLDSWGSCAGRRPRREPVGHRQGVVRCDSLFGRADHKLAGVYPEGRIVIVTLACLDK
jgi:hypothetical protein